MMDESNFHRIKRILIARNIEFTSSEQTEPRITARVLPPSVASSVLKRRPAPAQAWRTAISEKVHVLRFGNFHAICRPSFQKLVL